MWVTIASTCRLIAPTASWVLPTDSPPARAEEPASAAICDTRWALSAIWRDVARSSLMVVVISLIAVACSFAPDTCWLAADWSSVDELCTCWTADPICVVSDRVMTNPAAKTRMRPEERPAEDRRLRAARRGLDLVRAPLQELALLVVDEPRDAADLVHVPLARPLAHDLGGGFEAQPAAHVDGSLQLPHLRRDEGVELVDPALQARVVAGEVAELGHRRRHRRRGVRVGLEERLFPGDDEPTLAGLPVLDEAECAGHVLEHDV